MQCAKMFEVFLESVKHFKYWYFLVTPLDEVAHAIIRTIEHNLSYQYWDKFFKF